jgi:hypothetical protein
MIYRGRIPFTSDQSIISLMGIDIWEGGVHPVFCYGSAYGGTVEPHLLALVYGLLGPSRLTFYVFTGSLTLVAVLLAWALARGVFGPRAGRYAGLYLALGPSYFFFKGLTSDGAYMSLTICLGVALLGLVSITLREGPATPTDLCWLAGIGAALGLAWWILPISAAIGPTLLLAVFLGRREVWRAPRSWVLLIGAFLLGSAPWWVWNLANGWGSLKASELRATTPGQLLLAVVSFLLEGWPTIVGARSVWTNAATFPGAEILSWGVLILLIVGGRRALHSLPTSPRRVAGAMIGVFALSTCVLSFAIRRTDFSEPRYLIPVYLVLPALIGALLERLEERRALLTGVVAILLILGPGSQLRARQIKDRESGYYYDPYAQIDWLLSKGLRHLYAPYWSAYRITFLSGGRLVATPFGTGQLGVKRHAGNRRSVDADPAPGFLLDSYDMPRFKRYLARERVPHHAELREGYWLFTGLPPEALAVIRRCHCVPAAPRPGDVTWLSLEGPRALAPGESGIFRIDVRNTSRMDFQGNVIVGTRWRRPDGTDAVPEAGWAFFTEGLRMAENAGPPQATKEPGPATKNSFSVYLMDKLLTSFRWGGLKSKIVLSNGLLMGSHEELALTIKAPDTAGDYDLVVDLVDRDVTWFEWAGLKPMKWRVAVHGASEPAAP